MKSIIIPILAGLWLALAQALVAATFTVDTLVDENGTGADLSLREAIDAAASGDTIEFAPVLSGGTIRLAHGYLTIQSKSLTIDASMLPQGITVSGEGASKVFFIFQNTDSATVNLERIAVVDGHAQSGDLGGGVAISANFLNSASLAVNLTDCRIEGNHAEENGGAISVSSNATVILTGCSLVGNTSSESGGAISSFGILTATQCTIACNRALRGAAIHISGGSATLSHCTVTANTSDAPGATAINLVTDTDTLTLGHTIVAANSGKNIDDAITGNITSLGYNLIGDVAPAYALAADVLNNAPGLLEPMLNGGFSKTCAFRPDSPACDAGDPVIMFPIAPIADQRNFARFRDGDGDFFGSNTIDIGAYELGETVEVTTTTDELFTLPDTGTSLREALVLAAGHGDGARITFGSSTDYQSHVLTLGSLVPTSTVWIDGKVASEHTISRGISQDTSSRLLRIQGGHTVTVNHFNLGGGRDIDGGCVYVDASASLNLIRTEVFRGRGNRGAGIFSIGSVFMNRSVVSGCIGEDIVAGAQDVLGAGIFNNGRLEMVNSVVRNNTTSGATGGIFSSGDVFLNHCTIYGNRAINGSLGVGLHRSARVAELRYCVFADNSVNSVIQNLGGTVVSEAINAEDGNQLSGPDDLTGIDPRLDPALRPIPFESPLIDRGETTSCQRYDLEGNARITKGSANTAATDPARADLGAHESPLTHYVTTLEDQNSGATADGISLREAVAMANAHTGDVATNIAFDPTLCGKRIRLTAEMGGTLELQKPMLIRGPAESASSIEICGSYNDPFRAVTAADFPVFTISGPATTSPFLRIELRYLTISQGATLNEGGGIYFPTTASTTFSTIRDVVVENCRANHGGGVSIGTQFLNVLFERCSFSGNLADGLGGAIYNYPDPTEPRAYPNFQNCTFVENRADRGGAIYDHANGNFGQLELSDSTFTSNHATSGGGAISVNDGSFGSSTNAKIYNCVAVANFPNDIEVLSGDVEIEGCLLGSNPTGAASNIVTSDAKLGAFGDHGGTVPTVALLPGSPAIDPPRFSIAGKADARGILERDGDGNSSAIRDVGAYEYAPPTIFVTTANDEDGLPGDPLTSLREAIGIAQPGDVIQFDLPLNGQTITLNSELVIGADKFVEIDAGPLPLGVTVSGGGTSGVIIRNQGYAQFKGLVFTQFVKESIITSGLSFAHMRADACHFTNSGISELPDDRFPGVMTVGGCASAELVNSSFTQNRGIIGGVILNVGRLTADQCVFSNNRAGDGGVITNFVDGIASFTHCTFLGNSASPIANAPTFGDGQIAYNTSAIETRFHACIFDEDTTKPLFVSNPAAPGSFVSLGSNVARASEPTLSRPSDLTDVDPRLGPEIIHRVVRYHVPGQFSPAVDLDSGEIPIFSTTDIRGVSRQIDGNGDFLALADAGATETAPLILVDITHDENDGIGFGAGTSLRDAVEHVNAGTFPLPPVIGFAAFLSGQQLDVASFFGGEIVCGKGMTIDASNLPENPVVSGEGAGGGFRIFHFNAPGETVGLRCLNVRGGDISSEGGGIWVTNSTAGFLEDCEILENFAASHGGAVAVTLGAALSMERCSMVLNQAGGFGGGLFVSDASAQVIQSTFALNRSASGGGAFADLLASDIEFRHCTIADNEADAGGGGIDLQNTARISYSILARNQPVNFHDRGTANFLSFGYNIDDGTNDRFTLPSDIANIPDVEMGTIQFLGGRTSVIPLFLCSPAVDSGDGAFPLAGLPADQLGSPRILDGDYDGTAIIDRGAFELDVSVIDPDLDGDGIPNEWEVVNQYDPKDGNDAILDDDGDGHNNHSEYVAGTLPRDASSYLRVVGFTDLFSDQTAFLVEWTSNDFIPDLVYDVEISTDLVGWTTVLTDLPATPLSVTTEATLPVSQTPKKPKVFVRVTARRLPPI